MQHDWHVRDWRMARGQAFLAWGLFDELRRFMNMRVS
jgi:hypothetical protein